MSRIIGVDIGGTKCAVSVGDIAPDGRCSIEHSIKFSTLTGKDTGKSISMLLDAAKQLAARGPHKPEAIGISCGGPLDSGRGVILSPPNLPGWDEIYISRIFEAELGIPAAVQNDANACALAEWRYGAAGGCSNVIFLTFGTGMGAGLILNGKLYEGATGMAGEVGHMRLADDGPTGYGKAGSFEGFCSGGGIARMAAMMYPEWESAGLTAKQLAEMADAGDARATEVFVRCGSYLGKGLSILIDVLNPEIIVIGSIYQRSGRLLEAEMRRVIEAETLDLARRGTRIVPAGLGDDIGNYAAIAVGDNLLRGAV